MTDSLENRLHQLTIHITCDDGEKFEDHNDTMVSYYPIMVEYVVDSTNVSNKLYRIRKCENKYDELERIKTMFPNDREMFRQHVADHFMYHNRVYHDKSYDLNRLIRHFPLMQRYLDECPYINVFLETIKQSPSIRPMFNGSGCILL